MVGNVSPLSKWSYFFSLYSLFRKDRDPHKVEGNCKNGWTCFLWKLLPLWYHRRICSWRKVLQPEMCPASKKQVGAFIMHRNKEFGINAAWNQREILSRHILVNFRWFLMFFHCFLCACINSIWFCLTLMLKAVFFAQCAVFYWQIKW